MLAALSSQAAKTGGTSVAKNGALRGGQEPQKIALDVSQVKTLVLSASGYSWGQAVWGEPVLIGADGKQTKLTDLSPVSFHVGWGEFSDKNRGPDGKALKAGRREFEFGIFAHADSTVAYQLDKKFAKFESWVGVNHTAGEQGKVVFEIRDEEGFAWQQEVARLKNGFTRECLASLRRSLAGGDAELESRLAEFEKNFDSLRGGLEENPDSVRERLAGFTDLVRDIRTRKLDAPMLFVKRQPYFSGHIYDDYLTWHPGGGIYVLENPSAPPEKQIVHAVIDPTTKATLGEGVYRDPDLSFDAKKMLFAFKGEAHGDTSIYEIGLDGSGLRHLTKPSVVQVCATKPSGLIGEGHHDISPAYLPDGRIAFLSTRTAGLVMCFNNYIATMHSMNADGSNVKHMSVNNVSEFDPTVLPDGRVLYGRWEYVDKTALYMQSLWTVNPDGSQETALFKNNLAKPTAVLDARPVPNSELICASLTPHNGQSVGAIAMIDPRVGKNSLKAITNFTPEYPTEMDQGLSRGPSDPWPLDEDSVLIANNAANLGPNGVIELIDRFGFRFVIHRDPTISCFSPMLVKVQRAPAKKPSFVKDGEPAKFAVSDIYRGMPGIAPGTVKSLRILETTSRISGVPPGGRWWNQAFLVSWQGSYDVKNVIGVVPVEADGSAYFEAPAGKAIYFQALDGDGRMVQSMRTFVQAVPGVTRSCTGCHEAEGSAPASQSNPALSMALKKPAAKPAPESWGSGFVDYPSMVQPVLDRRCVSCHGEKDIAGGIDLSGGWTWAFNISYETLLKNTLSGFLNCNNGSVKTSEIQPPRAHGSGAAPLAQLLVSGHSGYVTNMPRAEIDLLMAWMDGNCNYYGKWDYTTNATCGTILSLREKLLGEMDKNGCVKCHAREIGNDWINLQHPELSRILRAPMAKNSAGGLALCRDHKAQKPLPLVTQAIQPPDVFNPRRTPAPDASGDAVASFADEKNGGYEAMLSIIRGGRELALQQPRVDMPGADVTVGKCRELPPLSSPLAAK